MKTPVVQLVAIVSAAALALSCESQAPDAPSRSRDIENPRAIVADPQLADAIDEFLRPLVGAQRLSGAVLVGDRSKVLFARAYGMANQETGEPNRLDTRYRIASLTKTLTSAAILRLLDRKELTLDDPLVRWAPEFPRADEITVRQLLLHQSGLGNPDYEPSFRERIDLDELAARIAAQPLVFDPGTSSRYSNAGYNTLALIVERTTGSYDTFLQQEILAPVGMERTGHPMTEDEVAQGYLPRPTGYAAWPIPDNDVTGFTFGSGSLVSTAEDLWRWGSAMMDEEIVAWKELEWPYGWGRLEVAMHTGIEQTGAVAGYMSSLLVLPDADRIVVTLHNVELSHWVQVAEGIAAIAVGTSPSDPGVTTPAVAPPGLTPSLSDYTGSYRSPNGVTFHVRMSESGKLLRMFWETWPAGKFLEYLGDDTFAPLGDGGQVRFERGADPPATAFRWSFGDDEGTRYERILDP